MINRKKIAAIVISVALHAGLLAAVIFYDVFRLYRSVEGLKIGDYGGRVTVTMINPADYGYGPRPVLTNPPRSAKRLEEIKRRKKDEPKPDTEDKQAQKKEEVKQQAAGAADSADQPLKFGRLDTHPIKQHVEALWQAHEQGRLALPSTFSITAVCKVNIDGSLAGVRVIESSGSEQMDSAALAILSEVSNQRAFAPLSRLSSVSVKLDVGPESASFTLTGFAPNAAVASDMAGQYQMMVSAARLVVSNSQTRELLARTSVKSDATRVSARVSMPRRAASQMMHDGFSGSE